MARVGGFDFDRVVIMPHAVERARARWQLDGTPSAEVAALIEHLVRDGVEAGFVFDALPRSFWTYYGMNARKAMLPPWQRFVQSRDQTRGVVVALDFPPDATAVTCLAAGRAPRLEGGPS